LQCGDVMPLLFLVFWNRADTNENKKQKRHYIAALQKKRRNKSGVTSPHSKSTQLERGNRRLRQLIENQIVPVHSSSHLPWLFRSKFASVVPSAGTVKVSLVFSLYSFGTRLTIFVPRSITEIRTLCAPTTAPLLWS